MINEQPKKKSVLLPICQLHAFDGHSYKVLDNEEMAVLQRASKSRASCPRSSSARWRAESMRSSADTAGFMRQRKSD